MPCIELEVIDHLRTRGIARGASRKGQERQGGVLAGRVQAQPLVMSPPARADRIALLDDCERQALRTQTGGARQTGGTRANDERLGLAQLLGFSSAS